MSRSVLVVSPHCDDESFGMGGTILKRVAAGDRVHVMVMVAGDVHFHHAGTVVRREVRVSEFMRIIEAYGCTGEVGRFDQDSRLDTVPLSALVDEIQNVQDRIDAETWYVAGPSFHQDHRRVFEATMAAARPTRRRVPEEIYSYELPTYAWNPLQWRFTPQLWENIGEHLDRKLQICQMYESQLRAGVLGLDHIRAHSIACGTESGYAAAERFEVVRLRRR